jgi:hypothetical protein
MFESSVSPEPIPQPVREHMLLGARLTAAVDARLRRGEFLAHRAISLSTLSDENLRNLNPLPQPDRQELVDSSFGFMQETSGRCLKTAVIWFVVSPINSNPSTEMMLASFS